VKERDIYIYIHDFHLSQTKRRIVRDSFANGPSCAVLSVLLGGNGRRSNHDQRASPARRYPVIYESADSGDGSRFAAVLPRE